MLENEATMLKIQIILKTGLLFFMHSLIPCLFCLVSLSWKWAGRVFGRSREIHPFIKRDYVCFQPESEWLKWGKGYIPAKSAWKRERERVKESLRHKSRLCEKNTMKGERENTSGPWGPDQEKHSSVLHRVNVSEGELSLVNHLWPSQLACVCVCVWWYTHLQTPVKSNTTGNMIHTMYSWPFPYVGSSSIHVLHYTTHAVNDDY